MISDETLSNVPDSDVNLIEEEKAATIQNSSILKNEPVTTAQRKISNSSRLKNAFTQLYIGSSSSCSDQMPQTSEQTSSIIRNTPTKGVENKLLSMWHNVKYSWSGKIKSNFSAEQPVWLLGRCYHRKYITACSNEQCSESNKSIVNDRTFVPEYNLSKSTILHSDVTNFCKDSSNPINDFLPQELGTDAVESQSEDNSLDEGLEGFRRDFYSRIWMTYRHEFPTMKGSNFTSDCGWGCMIRSGQMLLAQGLICHFLGRGWRYDPENPLLTSNEHYLHKKIIKWFGDSSSKSSPFSIHTLVSLGEQMGKRPGDWYGPASVSNIIKKALENATRENVDFDNIAVYVARDCTVYIDDLEDLCKTSDNIKTDVPWQRGDCNDKYLHDQQKICWKSIIILIPLRLGAERLNYTYVNCLKLLLSSEHCIGIIGGRPKHSLYFVGFQDDKLIHLDPHYCQEMVDVNQDNFPLHSFHCKSPRKLKLSKLDPSCCIGFYCQNKTDFYNFTESIQVYLNPFLTSSRSGNSNGSQAVDEVTEIVFPLFTFSSGRSQDHEKVNIDKNVTYSQENALLKDSDGDIWNSGIDIEDYHETEEFVVL